MMALNLTYTRQSFGKSDVLCLRQQFLRTTAVAGLIATQFFAIVSVINADDLTTRLPRSTPQATGMNDDTFAGIDRLVNEAINESKLPGAVVMIGYQGSVVFHHAYGNRQLVPEKLPMEPDTVFDLASLTKPIATATSVLKLVETGVVDLNDKVSKHIPSFADQGKQDVTIKQLLLHVGGMIPDNAMADYLDGPEKSRDQFLRLKLNYDPGTKFRYSDVGFQVLGELVRAATGKDIATYAAENVFRPLGMNQTDFLPRPELRVRTATTQQREGRWMMGEVHDPRAFAMGGIAGHAGLFSTADDLAIYAQMMLGDGTFQNINVLAADTVKMMTAAYEVPGAIRGLGWDKRSGYSSNRGQSMTDAAFGHGGFTGTAIWIDPGLELFVIFLSNRVHPDGKVNVNPLAGAIGEIATRAAISASTEPK